MTRAVSTPSTETRQDDAEREMREFWVSAWGEVSFSECFSCQQQGVWWCPSRGFTGSEGHQFFDTRPAAVLVAERWIAEERASLDFKESRLREARS